MFLSLRKKCKEKLNNNYFFESFLCFIFCVFGFLGWKFNYLFVSIPVITISVILLWLLNDFKYAIPAILVLLFSYGNGFVVEEFPFDIVIPVAIFVFILILFTIKNGNFKNIKSIKKNIGMLIISVAFIIPIFWSNLVTEETSVYYVMYFSWSLYYILFLLLCINLKKGSFRIVVFAFSWIAMLIVCELASELYACYLTNTDRNILSWWYYIGWGLCNEAGIVLCFIMPFIFYEMYKAKKLPFTLVSLIKIFILLVGILITESRGALLFGGFEFTCLLIVLIILKTPNKLVKVFSIILVLEISLITMLVVTDYKLFDDVMNGIFSVKLDDLGRKEIWYGGIDCWSENARNIIFGSGIISEIKELNLYRGMADSFVVYHSTVIETMVSSGIIGLIGLGIHFGEKYSQLKCKNIPVFIIFGVGYFVVDLYGLIDNTYGMYYYMVPLVIAMATFNNNDSFELFDNARNDLF